MDSPIVESPFSAPQPHAMDFSSPEESALPTESDRLYQIAALAAGIILLATVV